MTSAQKRALQAYRDRLHAKGVARFDVLGLDSDRALIRSLARRLAEDDPEALRLRSDISRSLAGASELRGGVLAALRRSPLVGADIDIEIERDRTSGRDVDL